MYNLKEINIGNRIKYFRKISKRTMEDVRTSNK